MNETDLKQAEHNIRELLDEMYGTSNLMTFDELAGKFSELLPLDFKVAFYIRAKARDTTNKSGNFGLTCSARQQYFK